LVYRTFFTVAGRPRVGALVLAALAASPVMGQSAAGGVQLLSAGAIEPGLKAAIAAYQKDTGRAVRITFNTAPQIRARMDKGEQWDVVIAPPAAIADFAKAGKIATAGGNVELGRVGLGVAVRPGTAAPDISSADSIKAAVLAADSIVFNRASTGLYFEGLLRKMGIYEQVEAKTTRYADGASVMEHVLKGKGNEIGFGPITEILLVADRGLRLVGPLPKDIQNYTSYTAALATGARDVEAARALLAYLDSPASRQHFAKAGIER
jgi:molybdate transport system substrate-binding protein